ncbi:MAG: ABC transporter ATP-binding protein [Spirochaetales bacterium]|nr:ABC transporter ATP-binding protein [Spirochaetales bacterium]MCF7937403.1 ABC transporter ATP-binding protein [Spirochaetales bacterium]
MALLEVKDLSIYYQMHRGDAKAVDGVSFSIKENETLGLIGESGCGKTTIALSLLRFIRPPGKITGGSIIYNGTNILDLSEDGMRRLRGNEIAIVRQEAQNALNPVLTVGEQIAEQIIEHDKVDKNTAWQRAKDQLELVGIGADRVRSYPHEFSGGMRQRVMIAIATANYPKLLILDEPITGLDVIVQRQLLKLIADLRDRFELTIIFIAHDLSVIAENCDRVVVMYAGKVAENSNTSDLYHKPLHPYSSALISSYPSILGERQELKSIPGAPPSLVNPPPGCLFADRCEHVMDICRQKIPPEYDIDGRSVACHLYEHSKEPQV